MLLYKKWRALIFIQTNQLILPCIHVMYNVHVHVGTIQSYIGNHTYMYMFAMLIASDLLERSYNNYSLVPRLFLHVHKLNLTVAPLYGGEAWTAQDLNM